MKKIIHITFLLSDKTSAHSNADGFHANKKKIMLGNISHCFQEKKKKQTKATKQKHPTKQKPHTHQKERKKKNKRGKKINKTKQKS